MKAGTRIPSELLWPLGWCAFIGVMWVLLAGLNPEPVVRVVFGLVGALYLFVAFYLSRLANWARVAAGCLFGVGVLLSIAGFATKGFTGSSVVRFGMHAWWGVYMFLPSTRRLFTQSESARLDPAGCLVQLIQLFIIAVLAGVLVWLDAPTWSVVVVFVLLVILLGVSLEKRIDRGVRYLLRRRPLDLDTPSWKAVREAQRLRGEGRHDEALARLDGLPDGTTVRALRILVRLDRLDRAGPLENVVLNSEYVPPEEAKEKLAREAAVTSSVERLFELRTEGIDALLEDDARSVSMFGEESEEALDKLTGHVFINNAMSEHQRHWKTMRGRMTGHEARTWLVIRLWERGAPRAAEVVAGGSRDAELKELALVGRMCAEGVEGRTTAEWVEENAETILLLPVMAESMRLLLVDLPYVQTFGGGNVAARLRRRVELVTRLRRLQARYPDDAGAWTALLVGILTGHPDGMVRKRKVFDAWWRKQMGPNVEFDSSFTAGLEAAAKDDWERAERAFGEAEKALPTRVSAAYNRAIALLRLDRDGEAERVFDRLAKAEPEEALFWMRLGDARRAQGKRRQALEDYGRAAQLGGLEEEVSVRLGVTLAEEGRDDEAAEALKPATGPEPDAGTLDRLADFLEAQGVFRLAHRYRQEALERELRQAREGDGDDDADESSPEFADGEPPEGMEFLESMVLGGKAMKMRNFGEAQDRFRRAVELQPDEAQAWYFLGLAFAAGSRRDEARAAYRKSAGLEGSPWIDRVECPECGWIPSGEPLWQCEKCTESLDTFKTRATCPKCSNRWTDTACIACGQMPPHEAWWKKAE